MSKFKVGDRVIDVTEGMQGATETVTHVKKNDIRLHWDGDDASGSNYWPSLHSNLIPAGHLSPIRTLTRKEIIAGTYGKVKVSFYPDGSPCVYVDFPKGSVELREAAHVLNQIAEALEENKR